MIMSALQQMHDSFSFSRKPSCILTLYGAVITTHPSTRESKKWLASNTATAAKLRSIVTWWPELISCLVSSAASNKLCHCPTQIGRSEELGEKEPKKFEAKLKVGRRKKGTVSYKML